LARYRRQYCSTQETVIASDTLNMPTEEFERLVDRVASAVATAVYLPSTERDAYEQAEESIAEARRSAEQTAAELKLC
jgi:hypothetical protein